MADSPAGQGEPVHPRLNDVVRVRHRHWLVREVAPPVHEDDATLVGLVCLDDDNRGRSIDVLWELERGAAVVSGADSGLGTVEKLDPPGHFAAYLRTLGWRCTSAADPDLLQAPFRAGIEVLEHQLTPLRKALRLPRANLLIADDVGLGKTIEAGLVVQELSLRRRVELVLVVCPSSVALQWQDEMSRRFGLGFEIVSRALWARIQRERGFGVNPWSTHPRFIVSHALLRRPEYRDPLLAHLGERATKSLLVLDEAHVAAPSGSGRYAIDSKITHVVRDVAPRFENRLFLSATPHNGHSNSFSALLELVDPQRFTRGVPLRSSEDLSASMVRRLKSDLRTLGVGRFPSRALVRHDVGCASDVEVLLCRQLADYAALVKQTTRRSDSTLVFVNLQKRLLSSVEAFHRTLDAHSRALSTEGTTRAEAEEDLDAAAATEDELEHARAGEIMSRSRSLEVSDQARVLLEQMLELSRQHRQEADAKARRLLEWIREHQCPDASEPPRGKRARSWKPRRVIIFTEYGDTKRYLVSLLSKGIARTDRADARIMQLHGGMSDAERDAVQRAFNAPFAEHPVRILVATDAAREGMNLQAHCADLFHFDVPWNPARLEQRNGRIDRALQPSAEVRCHYFVYPDREADIVLAKLVEKVDVIQRELGSIGAVLLDGMTGLLEHGIDATTLAKLEHEPSEGLGSTIAAELERHDARGAALRQEIEEAREVLARSRARMGFDPEHLRAALDVGLSLVGAPPLELIASPETSDGRAWRIPKMPGSWQVTLDKLRPPRREDEPFWMFRKRLPQAVVFRAPETMSGACVQLHLQHPFVERILSRFLDGGHGLSRVTVVAAEVEEITVLAFGRIGLLGSNATRLHDELLSVAARLDLSTLDDDVCDRAVAAMQRGFGLECTPDPSFGARVVEAASRWFSVLWPRLQARAEARIDAVERALRQRGGTEAGLLANILDEQHAAIDREMQRRLGQREDLARQLDARELEQLERETEYLVGRREAMRREAETEPRQIASLYEIALRRVEPIGLVVLTPSCS